jgi:hypothetical protein
VLEKMPPSQREVSQLSRLLHLFANFDVNPRHGGSRLVEQVLRLADELAVRQPVAIAQLSRAAAILGRPELAEARVRTLTLAEIDQLAGGEGGDREITLTMLQQWFLGRGMTDAVVPAELEGLASAARQALQQSSERLKDKRVSAMQSQVTRAAKRAEESFAQDAFALDPHLTEPDQVTEHVLDSGLSIDCAFPGYKLAIEADGPLHFFWNEPNEPNGRTAFKHKLLRYEGWLVVAISAEEWTTVDEGTAPFTRALTFTAGGIRRRIAEEKLIERRWDHQRKTTSVFCFRTSPYDQPISSATG